MSRANNEETPEYLMNVLKEAFHFTLDVAANHLNRKCLNYIDAEADGLLTKWYDNSVVWCNPPKSKAASFARKASQEKCLSVLLIPASFDSLWWQDYVQKFADHIVFLSKRIRWCGGSYAWEAYALVVYNCPELPAKVRELGLTVSLPQRTHSAHQS